MTTFSIVGPQPTAFGMFNWGYKKIPAETVSGMWVIVNQWGQTPLIRSTIDESIESDPIASSSERVNPLLHGTVAAAEHLLATTQTQRIDDLFTGTTACVGRGEYLLTVTGERQHAVTCACTG